LFQQEFKDFQVPDGLAEGWAPGIEAMAGDQQTLGGLV
jgi:hypothetical protein